jgi:predicted RNA-binding Zn-ribbon protein involved in translation (DUF1610 family)
MHSTSAVIGHCPNCGTAIPGGRVIIAYERGDQTAVFAECPDCAGVVHPQ